MITNTDLAYIAGYIDGDGCFYIGKTTNKKTGRIRYQSMIVISSTNKDTLKYFTKRYGGSCRMSDSRIKHPGQKTQYQFIIKGGKALQLAKDTLLYLVEKCHQAERFICFMETPNNYIKDMAIEFMYQLKHKMHFVSKYHKDMFIRESGFETAFEFDYAYLAGLIDAECCLGVQHYKPKNKPNVVYKIYLGCNNTKWPIFEWLVRRFGGGLHFVNRSEKNPAHRDQLQWKLSGRVLADILPIISKYLINKKLVCEQLIKFYATTLPNGGARHTETFRESYSKVIEERERIIHEVHRLNKKGI